jgi:hypothetical protein
VLIAEVFDRGALAERDLLRKSAIPVIRTGLPATRSEIVLLYVACSVLTMELLNRGKPAEEVGLLTRS